MNPTIETSGPPQSGDEGCLSVPGPFHELERASHATVRGVDLHGEPVEVSGDGFFARCLQHETDHLRGVLYIDHLPRNRRRRVLREMEPFEWNAPLPADRVDDQASSSAICTALSAAPLRRLSLLTNSARPRPSGTPGSCRMRPT